MTIIFREKYISHSFYHLKNLSAFFLSKRENENFFQFASIGRMAHWRDVFEMLYHILTLNVSKDISWKHSW